jgi:hypothetical protein
MHKEWSDCLAGSDRILNCQLTPECKGTQLDDSWPIVDPGAPSPEKLLGRKHHYETYAQRRFSRHEHIRAASRPGCEIHSERQEREKAGSGKRQFSALP